jgi:hypothetical protein
LYDDDGDVVLDGQKNQKNIIKRQERKDQAIA